MARGERFESAETRRERRAADDRYVAESDERRRLAEAELQAGHEEARKLEAEAAAIRAKLSEAEQRQAEERAARDREYAEGIVARYDADEAACRKALDEARRAFTAAAATDGADTVAAYRALSRAAVDLHVVRDGMRVALGTLDRNQHNGQTWRAGVVHLPPYSDEIDAALGAYRDSYAEDARHLADAERAAFINGGA